MKHTKTIAFVLIILVALLASCDNQQPVQHEVRFMNGDTVLKAITVQDGYLVCPFTPDLDDEGFEFDGWYADPEFSTEWDFANSPITQDTDIYSKWFEILVSITFKDKDGQKVDEKTIRRASRIGSLPEAPSVTGYAFSGWYPEGYMDEPVGPEWHFYQDCTLVAKYEKIVPKIAIHAFGDDYPPIEWEYGTLLPNTIFGGMAPPGFALDGWYADPEYKTEFDFEQPIIKDTDIYAKSHEIPTCVMRVYNGSNDELGYITVNKGDTLEPDDLSDYNQGGYLRELVGWYFNIERTQLFETSITMNENVSVYGKWQGKTVQVMLSGLGSTKYMDARYGELLPVPDVNPGSDKEILGWYWDDQFNRACDFEHDIVNQVDLRIYANAVYKTYDVTFDLQGHGSPIPSAKYSHWDYITPPEDPAEEGYIFGGWYDSDACTHKWSFSTKQITGPVTLYAKWSPSSI